MFQTSQIKMLVEQNSSKHRELVSTQEELDRQLYTNKLQQQHLDKLKAELEDAKAKNLELRQQEFMNNSNSSEKNHAQSEKLKEFYEKQLKAKIEEIGEKDRLIHLRQEEVLAIQLELDLLKTQH